MSVTARGRWLALTAALLGWMFDGMEMGLFPLVARSALEELCDKTQNIDLWFGTITASFLIGAATGGVLFGWLGDKLGRVKAMTLSVLVYSVCSGLSAFSASPWQLAVLRFLGALGMGGEWALGVALVMEVWPNQSRARLAAAIGFFGNLGYTVCGLISLGVNHAGGSLIDALNIIGFSQELITSLTDHRYWRLLMLLGTGPALLTMMIRSFVPESEKWKSEAGSGTSNWSGRDLLGVLFGSAIAGGVVWLWTEDWPIGVKFAGSIPAFAIITCGYIYPVWRYLYRAEVAAERRRNILGRMMLAAGISGVPLLGTWSAVMWMYQWIGKLPGGDIADAKPIVQISSSLGAAFGAMLGAWLGGKFGRRIIYAILCMGSILSILGFYRLNHGYGNELILSAGIMGLVTAAFYGWLPLYLPELFPTVVRASGQGFSYNYGRLIAAAGTLQVPALLVAFDGDYVKACSIVPIVYVAGLILIAFAPETKGKPLPD